jgi:hypothetical protein
MIVCAFLKNGSHLALSRRQLQKNISDRLIIGKWKAAVSSKGPRASRPHLQGAWASCPPLLLSLDSYRLASCTDAAPQRRFFEEKFQTTNEHEETRK